MNGFDCNHCPICCIVIFEGSKLRNEDDNCPLK